MAVVGARAGAFDGPGRIGGLGGLGRIGEDRGQEVGVVAPRLVDWALDAARCAGRDVVGRHGQTLPPGPVRPRASAGVGCMAAADARRQGLVGRAGIEPATKGL